MIRLKPPHRKVLPVVEWIHYTKGALELPARCSFLVYGSVENVVQEKI